MSTAAERLGFDAAARTELFDKGFELWMARPETKLILSLVPAIEHPDVLRTLLRSAFDAGGQVGDTAAMLQVASLLEKHAKPPGG